MVKRTVFLISLFLLLWLPHSGALGGTTGGSPPRFLVISSILPWGDLLGEICDGRCRVKVLIPPGATPHTWSPRPSALKDMAKARLFVYTSDRLEPWAREFVSVLDRRGEGHGERQGKKWTFVVDALLTEREVSKDPHLWFDFKFDQRVVDALRKRLTEMDPQGASQYEKGAARAIRHLKGLDQAYRDVLSTCRQKCIVVAGHNAFGRLAKAYGLTTRSVMGISPDAHITPRSLSRVINFIKEKGVHAIFFDHAVTDRVARILAQETGARVLELHVGVSLKKKDIEEGKDFFHMMEENLRALASGLECRGDQKGPF